MDTQRVVLIDLMDQRAEAHLNYNMKVKDRIMYDYDYKGKFTFIKFHDILPINPKDNSLMVSMGYRHAEIPKENSKGEDSIFVKTDWEKKEVLLKKSNIKSFIPLTKQKVSKKGNLVTILSRDVNSNHMV